MLKQKIKQSLVDCVSEGLYRKRCVVASRHSLLQFSSNDYLSLSFDPRVVHAYQRGLALYPVGSGGSMVVCGYHDVHQRLERSFAKRLGVDDCLLFSSGFLANLSVISLLKKLDVHCLLDKDVHASIYHDVSGLSYSRFLHNDLTSLTKKLNKSPALGVIMTEGLFSMSGQLAPLTDIAAIGRIKKYPLIVDEAHAFGVMGPEGLGAVALHQLNQQEVPLRIIPLGKAAAAMGAVVAGDGEWIDALLQVARPYIYSTGMSPALAYGLLETLPLICEASDRRAKLASLVTYFRKAILQTTGRWRDSHTAIQQLQLGCPRQALALVRDLRALSIDCVAIRSPTVRLSQTGLRVVLNYHHEPEHIDRLLQCIQQILQR